MSVGTPSQRDSDGLFRLVADSLPLLVWISGPDKRRTYFNKPWLDFTGRPLESEIGDGWADRVHAADLTHCLDTYSRAFDRREPSMMECRLRRHDGEYRLILDNATPLFDPDGSFAGYIGACVDVTEFRRAEAERNVANDRLRLAMESSKSVGWEWDLKTNRDTWFGDLSMVFGIPSNVYVGHVEDFRRSVHPEDRGLVWKAVNDAMKTRLPYVAEFRVLWPNGTVRWLAAKGQFYYSAGGDAERMLGMAVDITERKDAEESLRHKEMELKESQRLAGVGGWRWDPGTDTVVWSEELYRLTGRDPILPAVSYKEHSQLYSPESWHRLRAAVETALHTGAPYELVLEMVCADGTRRFVTARGEAQRDSAGQIVRLRGTVQDITERKRAEEALSSVNGRLIEAQESERARIARDLHDDIGQRLAVLAMALEHMRRLQPPGSDEALSGWTRFRSRPQRLRPMCRRCHMSCTRHGCCISAWWPRYGVSVRNSLVRKASGLISATRTSRRVCRLTCRCVFSGYFRKPCTTEYGTVGQGISRCIFAERGTPSTSPFVMKALALTSLRRVEARDSA
jgi:PAS domain S-box-containing protein